MSDLNVFVLLQVGTVKVEIYRKSNNVDDVFGSVELASRAFTTNTTNNIVATPFLTSSNPRVYLDVPVYYCCANRIFSFYIPASTIKMLPVQESVSFYVILPIGVNSTDVSCNLDYTYSGWNLTLYSFYSATKNKCRVDQSTGFKFLFTH